MRGKRIAQKDTNIHSLILHDKNAVAFVIFVMKNAPNSAVERKKDTRSFWNITENDVNVLACESATETLSVVIDKDKKTKTN